MKTFKPKFKVGDYVVLNQAAWDFAKADDLWYYKDRLKGVLVVRKVNDEPERYTSYQVKGCKEVNSSSLTWFIRGTHIRKATRLEIMIARACGELPAI